MRICLLLVLVMLPVGLFGQKQGQARVDSLMQELSSSRLRDMEDTDKVRLLNNISFAIHYNDPDEGLKYAAQALGLATKINWEKGQGLAYNSFYASYSTKSEYDSALYYCFKSLGIFESLGEVRSIAANLGNIAECFSARGDYPQALEYEFRELSIAESINNIRMVAVCEMNIGSTYMSMSQYKKAQLYFFSSLQKNEVLKDNETIGQCCINIGNCYYSQLNYQEALKYCFKGMEIFESLEEKVGIETSLTSLAAIYKMNNEFVKSLEYENRALVINKELGNRYGEAINYNNIGLTYLQLVEDTSVPNTVRNSIGAKSANLGKAVQYLERSKTICEEIAALDLLIKSYDYLSLAYRLSGRYEDAFDMIHKFVNLKDSVFSSGNKLKLAGLETQREAQLKEKQIEINKLSAIKKRNEQTWFIVGLALLSVVALAIVRSYYEQAKVNNRNVELLLQKDVLMKEIHHRVKNNLQVIGTLLELQLNNTSDEYAKDAMTESATRVKSISLIHQQLYQNENIATIEFAKFTKDLLYQVASVFTRNGQQITLSNDIPETNIDIDTAVPLGLILNELMTNSFKHAFAGVTHGTIQIFLHRSDTGYRLSYKDSGPGLPENMDIYSLKSLGMKLINRLSKQIGGRIDYLKVDKSFVIFFKDTATRKLID